MKKNVLFAAFTAVLLISSFSSCGGSGQQKQQGVVVETQSDSLYMMNDSTMADLQTFTYEGLLPMDDGTIGDCLLTLQSISQNENGTYTLAITCINNDSVSTTKNDNGQLIVLIGTPNDSTTIIYELISVNNQPQMNLMLQGDSVLTKVDKQMKPITTKPEHKLLLKK